MQPTTTNQFDQVLEYFRQMDLVLLDLVLDEHRTYQNMPSRTFLQMLGTAFRTFREKGNTLLLPFSGYCNEKSCHGGDPEMVGYSFVGESTPHYMTMIFQVRNGQVLDMFECSGMQHDQTVPGRNFRIRVDPFLFGNDDDNL